VTEPKTVEEFVECLRSIPADLDYAPNAKESFPIGVWANGAARLIEQLVSDVRQQDRLLRMSLRPMRMPTPK
jgi:hypothetical protein